MNMASITIRRLDDDVKTRLRTRAAGNGRSMEEEARLILREAVRREAEPENLAAFIHGCFAPFGGVELELPPRGPMREPPRFD
ncbi:MAG: plasmid stabilization protein [Boseongicola sp.]|nr:plasmid stabilization protein [Boseongicola sp.]